MPPLKSDVSLCILLPEWPAEAISVSQRKNLKDVKPHTEPSYEPVHGVPTHVISILSHYCDCNHGGNKRTMLRNTQRVASVTVITERLWFQGVLVLLADVIAESYRAFRT